MSMKDHRSLAYYNDKYTRLAGSTPVLVNDCTLREGEQSPLVNFRPDQKIALAHMLARVGVQQIQVGYPGLSQSDLGIIRELKRSGIAAELEAVVLGYLPNWEEQIADTLESGADVVLIVYVTSTPRRKGVFQVSDEAIKDRSRELVRRAKDGGLVVSFAPADTTRTELDFLLELLAVVEDAGADRLFIADSLGCSTPGGIRWLYEQVRSACALPLQYHGHNDFGLALANALAGVEAGATIVDTTLNGWGDRTGNPATEEFVAAMTLLYNNPVGIDLAGIADLARDIAVELDVPVSPMKPVTGSVAFAQKLETHVQAILKHPPAFESYDPALVGGKRQVAIGQYSGPEGVSARMNALGVSIPPGQLSIFVARVQETARATNRVLSDEDLNHLAREVGFMA